MPHLACALIHPARCRPIEIGSKQNELTDVNIDPVTRDEGEFWD